jgi:hypothetical protein
MLFDGLFILHSNTMGGTSAAGTVNFILVHEILDDTKGAIRNLKSKMNKQYNDQTIKYTRTNYDLENITQNHYKISYVSLIVMD